MKRLSIAMAGAALFLSVCSWTRAAVIDWGSVFEINSSSDIYNPGASGEWELAIDFSDRSNDPFRPLPPVDDGIINGIPFVRMGFPSFIDLSEDEYVFRSNFTFPNRSPGFWTTPTDDIDLDWLLDGHAWRHTNSTDGPGELDLFRLTPGQKYSIQLIGIADVRPLSTGRITEPDNGAGVFAGLQLRRSDANSVRGIFTADGETQTILLRSFGGDEVNHLDPGLCGFVLFAVPEPGSAGLFALALGGLFCRRVR